MKDRKKQKRAVSVSQRQPSPRHHLLPFADVKACGAEESEAALWVILPMKSSQLSTNTQINVKKMFFLWVGGVI